MMYGGNGWGWSAMLFMPLVWVTLLAVIIWAVVRLTQPNSHLQGPVDHGAARRESPQEILDRRFASGEIDAATYAQARDRPGLGEHGHTYATLPGAQLMARALERIESGRIVVGTAAPLYKCPAAPYGASLAFGQDRVRAAGDEEVAVSCDLVYVDHNATTPLRRRPRCSTRCCLPARPARQPVQRPFAGPYRGPGRDCRTRAARSADRPVTRQPAAPRFPNLDNA
jgi:putative membrane protein